MIDQNHQALARKIAERLLVNGFGDIGTRLEIKRETNLQKETSLGGWCLEAAVDQISTVIKEHEELSAVNGLKPELQTKKESQ